MTDTLRAFWKLFLGCLWVGTALLTWVWGYAIYKSIDRPRTETDAGEFLSPNAADVYPFFFVFCALVLVLITLAFRQASWPWPKQA